MSEQIILALIGFAGAVVGGAISAAITADATIKAAKITSERQHIPTIRHGWRAIVAGTIVGSSVGLILGAVFVPRISTALAVLTAPSIPLQIAHHYQFEDKADPTDVKPWISVPETKPQRVFISTDHAHSGERSLRLIVDIRSRDSDPNEYGGIGITTGQYADLKSTPVKASVAWVLLPTSEQTQHSRLFAHTFAYTFNHNGDDGVLYGDDVELVPGEWTPIFWAAAYTVAFGDFEFRSADRAIHEWYLNIWSDRSYEGSIYIDDIVLYTD